MSSQTCSPIFNKRRSHRSSINFNKNFNKNLTSFSIPDSGGEGEFIRKSKKNRRAAFCVYKELSRNRRLRKRVCVY
jgi:hypothetical protein